MSTCYKDSLVEVTNQEIIFHHYYWPIGGDKHVFLTQIESVEVRQPSLLNGSWRIWGSGDFRTWFPFDLRRPKRDRIFIAHLRNSSRRIGFTVEDSQAMLGILKEQGMIAGETSSKVIQGA